MRLRCLISFAVALRLHLGVPLDALEAFKGFLCLGTCRLLEASQRCYRAPSHVRPLQDLRLFVNILRLGTCRRSLTKLQDDACIQYTYTFMYPPSNSYELSACLLWEESTCARTGLR